MSYHFCQTAPSLFQTLILLCAQFKGFISERLSFGGVLHIFCYKNLLRNKCLNFGFVSDHFCQTASALIQTLRNRINPTWIIFTYLHSLYHTQFLYHIYFDFFQKIHVKYAIFAVFDSLQDEKANKEKRNNFS